MLSYEQILDALANCCFDDLNGYNYYDNIIALMDNTIINPHYYEYGATKLVLLPPHQDFVIKIPFCGYDDEFWDSQYYPFENAEEPDGWNYCEVEKLKYAKAKEAGIEFLFAETKLIGYVKDHPIYVQPKMKIFSEAKNYSDYSVIKNKRTKDKCHKSNINCFHVHWISDFLDYFDIETLQKLDEWLENNNINDLHGGNLGYHPLTGQPIIIDYSDFND